MVSWRYGRVFRRSRGSESDSPGSGGVVVVEETLWRLEMGWSCRVVLVMLSPVIVEGRRPRADSNLPRSGYYVAL